jgi:hypothetical protein
MMHDLDINGFNLQHEYFASTGHKKFSRSNLDFLSFTIEETPEYKTLKDAFDKDSAPIKQAIADFDKLAFPLRTQDKIALNETNKKKLAELQTKFDSDVMALSQKLGAPVKDRAGQVAGWLKQINDLATGFGVGTSGTKNEVYTQTLSNSDLQGGGSSGSGSNRTLFIVLGAVAVIGLGALVYFKTRK